jgi:hypothetical protein
VAKGSCRRWYLLRRRRRSRSSVPEPPLKVMVR